MSLKVIDIIENRINKMRAGYIFTSSDFYDLVSEPTMVSRALRQLIQTGKIRKYAKGRFYKPQQSIFGTLPPSEGWIVQDYLMDGKRIIGYLTGQYVYSKLGLSTQISSAYTIGSNTYRRTIQRNGIKIRFVLLMCVRMYIYTISRYTVTLSGDSSLLLAFISSLSR